MSEALEKRLLKNKIKPTTMRLLVLEALSAQKSALSLSELEKTFEKSDRITLYRTLKTFQNKGLVHSIDDGTGAPKYALCEEDCECELERDLHVHFHCRLCGETFCLPTHKIPVVRLPANYLPEEANLVIKGICERCA